jgi:hypothetical protein
MTDLLKGTTQMKFFTVIVNASGMKIEYYVEAADKEAAKAQALADFAHLAGVKVSKVIEG